MTNDAMRAILEYFFQEATGSSESALRVAELLRGVAMDDAERAGVALGNASADRLLRSIDDVRKLLSPDPAPAGTMDEFDLVRCAAEIVEVLNLASGRRVEQLVMGGAPEVLFSNAARRRPGETVSLIRYAEAPYSSAVSRQSAAILQQGQPRQGAGRPGPGGSTQGRR